MYKTRLQQMCQKKKWGLPKYSYVKEGPEHIPFFKASVVVNGVTFDTTTDSKSSKDAQNDAAMLAVHHFTTTPEPRGETERGRPGAGIREAGELQWNAKGFKNEPRGEPRGETKGEKPETELHQAEELQGFKNEPRGKTESGRPAGTEIHQAWESESNARGFKNENTLALEEIKQYKLMLRTYAQRNKLSMPVYSSQKKGPVHAPCFEAKVVVDGHPYESPGSYKTLKEAENAAAQAALLSLNLYTFQENGSTLYKNFLQELAQSEGFILPIYKTENSGEPHKPSFISTVEVAGETFHGTTAKSKKQAESNAARAAYNALMGRKRSRTANCSSSSSASKSLKVKPGSVFPTSVTAHGNFKSDCPVNANFRKQCIQEKGDHEASPIESLPNYCKFSSQKFIESQASADMDNESENRDSCFSPGSMCLKPTGGQSSSIITPPDLSSHSIEGPNLKKSNGTESYLLCNRFRVYTSIPDIDFPKGTLLLPIAEDQWVAVSLELPN